MTKVWVLEHRNMKYEPGETEVTGVFSSFENAEAGLPPHIAEIWSKNMWEYDGHAEITYEQGDSSYTIYSVELDKKLHDD